MLCSFPHSVLNSDIFVPLFHYDYVFHLDNNANTVISAGSGNKKRNGRLVSSAEGSYRAGIFRSSATRSAWLFIRSSSLVCDKSCSTNILQCEYLLIVLFIFFSTSDIHELIDDECQWYRLMVDIHLEATGEWIPNGWKCVFWSFNDFFGWIFFK